MAPQEVALFYMVDKLIGRGEETRDLPEDSIVDIAGYADLYEEVKEYLHNPHLDITDKRLLQKSYITVFRDVGSYGCVPRPLDKPDPTA